MGKKIVIDSGCIACGLCFSSPFIEELTDGKAGVKGVGILSDSDEAAFAKTMEACPVKAISLATMAVKSKDEVRKQIDSKLAGFKIDVPDRKELLFDSKYIDIQVPGFVYGEFQYEYSSYDRAKSAAKEAVDKAMYSQRKIIIQNIINNYSMDKLSPYVRFDASDKNFYYNANKKAEQVLKEILQEILLVKPDIAIPKELTSIQSSPDLKKDIWVKTITENLTDRAWCIIQDGMSGEYYSLSYYADDCDIDDMEVYAGKGLFGSDKYTKKYCYRRTKAAFDSIAKDIRDACNSYFNEDIVDFAVYGCVEHIVKEYAKLLQDELNQKANELKKLL